MVYEVWDTLTSNRIGAFATRQAAEALLHDVLRVNGRQAVEDMAVLGSDTDTLEPEPALVIDGAEFAARFKVAV
jgi:hypothetical protein